VRLSWCGDIVTDAELLQAVIDADHVADMHKERAEDMLFHLDGTNRPLTPAQRKYMESVLHGEKYERPVDYENLISSGKAPRGAEVELKVGPLPKRPPQRMSQ
jgi:hypothetical protein